MGTRRRWIDRVVYSHRCTYDLTAALRITAKSRKFNLGAGAGNGKAGGRTIMILVSI